ncbi:peptide MFS transporter [Paenimyroides aestuarii]|uniref:Peptide MFS transporter n=1 Tax=Paenimyroides aestuarii TaxID=2968490 RepID=A0ABY5NPL5_9FLAO|nr:peptide MFS transporter [Paenimyroides aestuarii]UUV20456.1 peptide MFS transporter [Paenimyroides aestuarii]
MATETANPDFFKSKVLGHPSGLFVLFFTEMWERFSFYGMRVLLINFLTMAIIGVNPGWEWSAENAGALYGTYAMLLYITPIFGGIIADKYIGYRWAVVIGSIIMTLGHASMAFDTEISLYLGLGLLVIGTGFFKPNMTSILSEMYKAFPEKKDGAYTIFYMGVNAGAFFGMMLCGYLAENVGWHWGFGLAGIFMLLGTLQFWLAKPLFGNIGEVPSKEARLKAEEDAKNSTNEEDKRNPFTMWDKILIVITSVIGLLYAINDPLAKIGNIDLFKALEINEKFTGQNVAIIIALILFLVLVIGRMLRYTKVVRDRMIAVIIFAFFVIFFWMSFEQGATSLVLFARDNTQRILSGNSALIFNIVNTILTIAPLLIVSWVLYLLAKQTIKRVFWSNIVLIICFLGVWGVAGWMLNKDWTSHAYEIKYNALKVADIDEKTNQQKKDEKGALVYKYIPVSEAYEANPNDVIEEKTFVIATKETYVVGDQIKVHEEAGGKFVNLTTEQENKIRADYNSKNRTSKIVQAEIKEVRDNQVEITVSWFSILNSFFIIAFASFISKIWDSKYNPPAAVKYGMGLIVMAIGFGLLAFGSYGVQEGVKVSMIWLILAYLFHTLGELCLSPVGLSYVSKLVPARMIAFMFGMWYLAIAIGNKLAAILGGQIENITKEYSLSTFFLIFTIVPIVAGLIVMSLNPLLKKLMHGVK